MTRYKGYLIDLDGTMYAGTQVIPGAPEFIDRLNAAGIPYLFVTNNSSRTPEQVAEKLVKMGIRTTPENVFTTSRATAQFIHDEKPGASVYVIGEDGILEALAEQGLEVVTHENPDYVVTGIDRGITYEKLAGACLSVRNGARFISTNGDIAIPTERGFMPGNGSLTSVVSVSTETQPVFIGKPEPIIMEQAMAVLGTSKEETIMVGDYYDTDIRAGIGIGIDTLLVHTGVTQPEFLKRYEVQPTHTRKNLNEWEL
ncbi:TIGR01457 family HAD-type hydrolase [Domibacillus iocasae]|uniref:HAD family hydrolase n=1 Tax=Domibacillus iocasae TaxID=1714016 RepID=A0A1E7DU21_9BACI|nr:TIGR01457 family HAD-type hydrolase [Domibacillus iocasae]OES46529.1 HAD family hydrolase [Domibacillus iocasae]